MKVHELISALSLCPPFSDISFHFGGDDEYRLACARLIAEQPLDVDFRERLTPMLEHLDVACIDLQITAAEIHITLEQGYIKESCIDDEIKKIGQLTKELKTNKK